MNLKSSLSSLPAETPLLTQEEEKGRDPLPEAPTSTAHAPWLGMHQMTSEKEAERPPLSVHSGVSFFREEAEFKKEDSLQGHITQVPASGEQFSPGDTQAGAIIKSENQLQEVDSVPVLKKGKRFSLEIGRRIDFQIFDQLELLNLQAINQVGSGQFGTVYDLFEKESNTPLPLLIKVEKELLFTPAGSKFWRRADFALTRVNVRSTLKPLAFFLVLKPPQGEAEAILRRWNEHFAHLTSLSFSSSQASTNALFLPAKEAKNIGTRILREFPQMEVAIAAQIMPRAPGENLEKILVTNKFRVGEKKFRDLLHGCGAFLEDTHFINYVHLDIKPANIIFDQASGSLTLIDYGMGYRGMKKYHEDGSLKLRTKRGALPSKTTNPRVFSEFRGSLSYMAPQVESNDPNRGTLGYLLAQSYQSNVDAYSIGLVWLESLGLKKHYRLATQEQHRVSTFHLLGELLAEEKHDLHFFLQDEELIKRSLQAHPFIFDLLEKTFQYAQNKNIEENFRAWQQAFHSFERAYGYQERENFPGSRNNAPSTTISEQPLEERASSLPSTSKGLKAGMRGLPGGWNYED